MGLDMYLSKRTYVKRWDHQDDSEKHEVIVKKGGEIHPSIDAERISEVIEEIMYWRKANHIHKWFVDNCQGGVDDCRDAYVSFDELVKLRDLCKKVIDTKDGSLLPTSSGFFFGNTDYDEYYFMDTEETYNVLDKALSEEGGSFYYSSSW